MPYRKLKSLLLLVLTVVKRPLHCWRRRKKSEDFSPISVVVKKASDDAVLPQWDGDSNQWNSWQEKPFTNVVEEKIEEYRKKMTEKLQEQPEVVTEPNYFNDMEPEVKHTRKAYIGKSRNGNSQKNLRTNLFTFTDNESPAVVPSGELGLLDDRPENPSGNWEDSLDVEEVDEVLRAQRAKERHEKQMQRRLEHERRLLQKKGLNNVV
uniref:Receptor-binding cancer antigen expressed on SiSo cells n=1 Tax=Syphacia muris TaxID=451379 RepID=A0A0N5AVA6_9BILA